MGVVATVRVSVPITFLHRYMYLRIHKWLGVSSLFSSHFHHHFIKKIETGAPPRIATTPNTPHYRRTLPYLQGAASGYRLPSTPLIGASANLVTFLPGPPLRSGPSGAE